ncbi:MAG: hypothetical protein AMXMBFR36_37710 [Acidobacteriota bacterium]
MAKYLTELVGTFFLVLTVGLTVIGGGTGVIPPLAIGAALMVMVYAGGHVSGGHYNPAVSLGARIRGRLSNADLGSYWFFQLVGAGLAVLAVNYLRDGVVTSPMVVETGPAFLAEFLFTFALVYVVLNVATARKNANNSFYGLAIGMTVMVGAFAVGNISGAAFNPAVYVGASALGLLSWSAIATYLGAQLLAGACAGLFFKALNPGDH